MVCRYCGKELKEDSHFCNRCGKNIEAHSTAQNTNQGQYQFYSAGPQPQYATSNSSPERSKKYAGKRHLLKSILSFIVLAAVILVIRSALNVEQDIAQALPPLPDKYVEIISSLRNMAIYYDSLSTDAQKEEFLSIVAGQSVTWIGTVGEVYDDSLFPNMIVVMGNVPGVVWCDSCYVYCNSSQHSKVMSLNKDDLITFKGTLSGEMEFLSFKITNGKILE